MSIAAPTRTGVDHDRSALPEMIDHPHHSANAASASEPSGCERAVTQVAACRHAIATSTAMPGPTSRK